MKTSLIYLLCILLLFFVVGSSGADIKYALSMFHFNIQYVCGGLEGIVKGLGPIPSWELNAIETEDMIVEESFEPVVNLLMGHPNWSLTFEMQGYFLDVLAERHPDVLANLRTLAKAGRAEVVSFHYSDQLFIGYPYEDWKRSVELTIDTFAKHDIPLSKAVFCQEGQASPGMKQAMEEYGYEVMVWPKNLWSYQYNDFDADPFYTFGNIKMIAGAKGVSDPVNGVYMTWTFFGDGELLATNDWDPYFPWFFKHSPTAVAEYEDRLQSLEDQGYVIGAVTDYVDALENAAITPSTPPDLMGGTWQPSSTDGTHRWMGGSGLWGYDERDNFVRTLGATAHRELLAAETMNEQADLDMRDQLDQAWRLLALGQVTDATGINPFRGEIEYGIAHMGEVVRIAAEVIESGKTVLRLNMAKIDTKTGTVTEDGPPMEPDDVAAPIDIEINVVGRDVVETWYEVSDDPLIYKLEISFSARDENNFHKIEVLFPGAAGPIEYSPGLMDEQVVSFDRSQFVFEHFYLPLANGLIGLGNGKYLVKDQAYCHLSAQIYTANPDVIFRDETAGYFEEHKWVFYLVEGQTDALDFALNLNVTPTLYR